MEANVKIIIAVCIAAVFFTHPSVNAEVDDTPVISGKVFSGAVGDESTPIQGVTLTLYGSMSPSPTGDFLDTTVTGHDGWYSLDVTSTAYIYFNIIETDLGGYTSVGASSGDGTVGDANWIYYSTPLTGKDLTGNRFWDESAIFPDHRFQGKVFVTDVPQELNPREGVTLSLYGGPNPMPAPATLLNVTTTNAEGWYIMGTVVPADYYTIVLTVPDGFRPVGASTQDGLVYSPTIIEIVNTFDLSDPSMGNIFWIKLGQYLPLIMRVLP